MTEKAEQAAASVPGARVAAALFDAIADDEVDAILLATPGPTHEKQLLACLEHGKPVPGEAVDHGFGDLARGGAPGGSAGHTADPGRLHAPVRSGVPTAEDADRRWRARPAAGDALRAPKPAVPPSFDSAMVVRDSLVHEVDVTRFLLGD